MQEENVIKLFNRLLDLRYGPMKDQVFDTKEMITALNVPKEQFSHWIHYARMTEPLYKGVGRGGRNQYSYKNLLDLALVKKFASLGIETHVVKLFLIKLETHFESTEGEKTSIWDHINSKRRYYEKRGLYLLFGSCISDPKVLDLRKKDVLKSIYDSESYIIINVMKILSDMEKQINSLRKLNNVSNE